MEFDIIGIIYLVIIFISLIVGLKKGLFKTIIKFIKSILSMVISTFLSKPIANFLAGSKLGTNWSDNLTIKLTEKGGVYASEYQNVLNETIFKETKLPDFVAKLLEKLVESLFPNIEAGTTVAEVLAPVLVYYSFIVIAFVSVFLLLQLVVIILNKLFGMLENSSSGVKFTNRLLGGLVNAFIGFLIVCIISYFLSFLVRMNNGIGTWLQTEMKINEETMTISKMFYEKNFLGYIITFIQTKFFK